MEILLGKEINFLDVVFFCSTLCVDLEFIFIRKRIRTYIIERFLVFFCLL